MWKNGKFLKDSKYQIFKNLSFQKGPQIPVLFSVFIEKGLNCKNFQKLRGFSGKIFSFPLFFSSGQKAAGELPASPAAAPRPGRCCARIRPRRRALLLLSLSYPLALSSLSLFLGAETLARRRPPLAADVAAVPEPRRARHRLRRLPLPLLLAGIELRRRG